MYRRGPGKGVVGEDTRVLEENQKRPLRRMAGYILEEGQEGPWQRKWLPFLIGGLEEAVAENNILCTFSERAGHESVVEEDMGTRLRAVVPGWASILFFVFRSYMGSHINLGYLNTCLVCSKRVITILQGIIPVKS